MNTRKKILAGNWKMNLTLNEGVNLVNHLIEDEQKNPVEGEIVILPAFPFLQPVSNLTMQTGIRTGAQNVSEHEKGAFTGEVSAQMLKDCGAAYVIVGHSERRSIFHESDQMLSEKIAISIKHDLIPIFCVGEQKNERTSDRHFEVVSGQLYAVLNAFGKDDILKVVIAYEPVWAIGTGLNASPEQAGEMHAFIRRWLSENFGNETANQIPLLYGGSCKPSNAADLFSLENIDGGLIGGASLDANSFIALKEILFSKKIVA